LLIRPIQGEKVHFVSNGNPEKQLLLFIHGFPEFWFSWRNQLREFGSDYYAVAIDCRGYGESAKPKGVHNYKMQSIVPFLKDFMESLGKNHGIIVGHDWGGMIAFM